MQYREEYIDILVYILIVLCVNCISMIKKFEQKKTNVQSSKSRSFGTVGRATWPSQ